MSHSVAEPTVAPPPEAQIAEILLSQLVPRLVNLIATLKLADHLAEGPKNRRGARATHGNACACARSHPADSRQPGLRHGRRGASLRAATAGGGSQNRYARPCGGTHPGRRVVHAQLRQPSVFRSDRPTRF